ncbi:MAG: hypothetical protein FXF47_00375 [Candidatus Mcinerneyibacterium aminivorans]|uniref:Uncharacterized protein n=1 Tax=Candidatus Mcinerneyibacterium aminivorans TaxID=2703815 RepID=A0A5D0MGR6_9BACT|nr:MAG: hypothetical protein FXF47_00375 [Candidatus Mcinerneyibacterium aminivorans]
MNWEMLVAAIGAAAWIPKFVEYLKPCRIKIKLISEYKNFAKNPFNNKNGIIYLFKMGLVSLNKSFSIKDIEINIKYKNRGKKKCERIIW